MSEQADRERVEKRGWAAPGGAHDHMINALKLALPAAIGVVLAFLAFSPLEEKQEVSFVLDKTKVGRAEERMRIDMAQYRGVDDRGRPFVLNARSALQPSSSEPIVFVRDMRAWMNLENGPAQLVAQRARYDLEQERARVMGPILLTTADGYRLTTRDVTVDLNQRRLFSDGEVRGVMPLGRFSANRMEADLASRRVVLSGRARLHIVQGGVG